MTPRFRIEGIIGEGSATAASMGEFLHEHAGRPVKIIDNSPGGNAFEGAAIMAEVEAHGQATVVIRGIAASAASLLAMGAKRIEMHEAALMMIHDPSGLTYGTSAAHRESAATLDQIGAVYAAAYAKRTGIPARQIAEMMAAETWFDAATAVQLGFADAVEEAAEPAVAARFDYTRFKNAPARLMQMARAEGWAAPTPASAAMEVDMLDHETGAETPTPEAVATAARPDTIAERTRAKRIADSVTAAGLSPQMADELIAAGTPLDEATTIILRKWKEAGDLDIPMHGRPTHATVGDSWDAGAGFREKVISGICAKLDPKGEHSALARDGARMTLAEVAMQACRMQGLRPFNEVEAVRMATHSTSDFPLILEGALGNTVARRIQQRMPDLARASHRVDRFDYRPGRSQTLSETGMPAEIAEGGEIEHTTMEEKGEFLPRVRDFAIGINLSNQALTNDATAVGALNQIVNRMAEGNVERLRAVLLEPLLANAGLGQTMADGQPMFHSSHGNVAASGAALDITTLSAARLAMRRQKGLKGAILSVEPWGLIVPPELETTAQKLLADIDATKTSDANPFAGALELIVEPGFTSATAWYVCGDPGRYDGLAHAFLDGAAAPRIESRAGWNTLGMEFRSVWTLDAKFVETATWYRNAGG